jgi:hypothetical protein
VSKAGMNGDTPATSGLDDHFRLTRTYRLLVRGTNINATSLLATDYLNHFNEVVMILEMVPDMPEIIEDALEWQPASYIEHFAASVFSDKELAIWAYKNAPKEYIESFEELVAAADTLILRAVNELSQTAGILGEEELRAKVTEMMAEIREIQERIGGVINGTVFRLDQKQIDLLFSP